MIMLQRPRISSTINTIIAFIVGRLVGVLAGISFSFIVGDYIIFGNWSFNFYWPVVLFVSEFATLSILFWGNHNYVVPNYLSWGLISIFGFTFGAELNKYSLARISEFFSFHISNLGFIILFLVLAQSFIIRKYIPLKSWITLAFILIILENAVYNFFGLNSSAYWVIAVWVITWIAQGILINRHINKRWWVWAILNIIILIVGIILESMISESGLEKKLNTRFDDVLVKEIMDRFSIYIPYYLNFIVTGFYLFYGNIQDLSFSKKVRGNI